jgi:glutamine amidotransferase
MIAVVDYNVGNVRSVCNAFRHIGCPVTLSRDMTVLKDAAGLVLPGVAAFGYAINALGSAADLVKQLALNGKPLLGICVGYQMLFDESFEYGRHEGLGLIAGSVVPILPEQTVPHMGWNQVQLVEDIDLFMGLGAQKHFYFAHSFYAKVTDTKAKITYTDYGFSLAAAVRKENIYGVQFHPEKSGKTGLRVLENFAKICE